MKRALDLFVVEGHSHIHPIAQAHSERAGFHRRTLSIRNFIKRWMP